jgi:CRISPR system Cascade subunit CasA
MNSGFSLVSDPWIPVVTPKGECCFVGILDVFTNGDHLADLAVRPHERIALMRLLICVAQAALDGPASDYDSPEATASGLTQAAKPYLEKWRKSFDLFHPKTPFLQCVDISKSSKRKDKGEENPKKKGGKKSEKQNDETIDGDFTPTSKLDFALATGNNTTLFDHGGAVEQARAFTAAQLALMLLTFQNFSPGGLIAQVRWKNGETSKTSKHAPCTPGSMLHGFLRRDNLFATVCANLLSKALVERVYGVKKWGMPIWESPPLGPDDTKAITNLTSTYLGRLVPISRLIRLEPDDAHMLLGDGIAYTSYKDGGMRAPSATEVAKKDGSGRTLLGVRSRALWRELHALTLARHNDVGGALTLLNVRNEAAFDYWVGAFLTNKATVLDTVESVFHVPAQMLGEQGYNAYDGGVQYAEAVAKRLNWAIGIYRQQIDGGWQGRLKSAGPKKGELLEQLHSHAARHYWTRLESHRDLLLSHVKLFGTKDGLNALDQWRVLVNDSAREAYRLVCGMETPRQVRAYAIGWDKLTMPVDKTDSDSESPADKDYSVTQEEEA